MKNKILLFTVLAVISTFFAACSSMQQTSGRDEQKTGSGVKKDSLYVFDQAPAPAKDTIQNSGTKVKAEVQNTGVTYYLIQIGAFTTKERADEFADMSRKKIQDEISVTFKSDNNLYVVQLAEHYSSHEEAEKERNILWKIPEFKDAWIVSENK
jgi:Sporulation related domain.